MRTADTGSKWPKLQALVALTPGFISRHGHRAACGEGGGEAEVPLSADRAGGNSSKGPAGR